MFLIIGLIILAPASEAREIDGAISLGYEGDHMTFAIELANFDRASLGAGMIYNQEYSSDDIQEYRTPHDNYTLLGEKNVDPDYGVYAKINRKVYDGNIILSPGIGIYSSRRWVVAASNVTDYYYKHGDRSTFSFDISFTFYYNPDESFLLGIGASRMRGIYGSFGYQF